MTASINSLHENMPKHIEDVYKKAICLVTEQEIYQALDKMAEAMTERLANSNPIFLAVVNGAMIPIGHLLLRLAFPLQLDYIHATRYQGATVGKELRWKAKPSLALQGRTVVIVDDILDGGSTFEGLVDYVKGQGAEQVYTVAIIDKKRVREPGGLEKADFIGIEIEDYYVFGFGLDYKEYLRNVPGIYRVADEHL
ncbi:MAG TPA: hypoxanthine-guanine phosphoribosyltransferase [Coxiellaceae bacterium]|nr:hypoxanthine-guanine phosphoribosyltransferase [Coxiellaceae bacterium]